MGLPIDAMWIPYGFPKYSFEFVEDLYTVGFSIQFLRISSRVPSDVVWIEAATSLRIRKWGLHPQLS